MENRRSPEDRFDEAFRAWADRPPRLDASAAAKAVASRVGERRRPPQHLAWALATAAAVALGVASLLVVRTASPPQTSQQVGMVLANPTLTEGQVLIWLDEHTSLNMTYATPDAEAR